MKKSTLSMLMGTAALASIGTAASAAPTPALARVLARQDQAPLSRMKKATAPQHWSGSQTAGMRQMQRVAPHFTSPASDTFEYSYAPDGSLWYAACSYETEEIQYEYYTERLLKGFTVTIYDQNFKEIGQVRDRIELLGDETKCVQIMVGSQLTKRFFNNDDAVEVLVSFSMNTPSHVNNNRTKAYSVRKLGEDQLSTALATVDGYPVDYIDCSKDKWSEDYYITFLTEEHADDSESYDNYIDFLAAYKQVLTTMGKGLNPVKEYTVRMLDLPGDQMNSPMMLSKKVNGKLTIAYPRYEKSFFVDPSGMGGNEAITADNNLIIDIYQMNDAYPAEMELISTTKIPTVQNTDNPDVYCTYYGIGTLSWDGDVDFEHYTADGRPAFIVTTDDYLYSDDDHYNSGYFVFDADGKKIGTIAENTYDYVRMADIPGFEPQTMFVHMGDDMNFQFVDHYSCKTVTTVDHMYRGYSLSISTDRVPSADGYVYASALSYGMALENDELGAPVCWFDKEGELIRVDVIPTGTGTELAQIYMNSDGLGSYVFNTDADLEYMMLVKRNVPGMDSLREELIIATPENGPIHTFMAEEGKGAIRGVYLMAGADPQLVIAYMDDDYKFTADAYSLPFDAQLDGSGTLADPYLITTGGELQLIKNAPNAYYRLANDIDCAGVDYYPIAEFKGTLDGDGHSVSNLCIVTRGTSKTGLFVSATDATFKDIVFDNPSMVLSGAYEAGLISAYATRTKFDNVHVRGLKAIGNTYAGEFGALSGKAVLSTSFDGCEVADADVNLPSAACMGGIVGDIRTGCTATGCLVSGRLTSGSTLGGIVGSTTTGDEVISQCHVDASLKAQHTIGGIVGFLDRSKVKSNYVEGTIEATKPSKWNNAVSIGGIAGELEGDWQGNADVPVVQNLIGISAFITPDMTGITEQHPRQLATVHRVVGRSCYNAYLEEEPSKVYYENGVFNNYVVSGLAVIDPEFDERSIEGTSIDSNVVDNEWLANTLGFAFGNSASAPWSSQSQYAYDPCLWYETSEGSNVEDIVSSWTALSVFNGIVIAEGHAIVIFDINGKAILSGSDSVDTAALAGGVYVAVATDKAGKSSTLKFVK